MAVTYTGVPLPGGATGVNYRSVVRNVLLCIGAAAASEAITLNHGLNLSLGGACPTEIRTQLRSVITTASSALLGGGGVLPVIGALNQSLAVLNWGGGASSIPQAVMVDIIAEFTTAAVS